MIPDGSPGPQRQGVYASTPPVDVARRQIAIVGSGIAGLSCAWLLSEAHDVTLYEAEPRLGGHSHTIDAGPVAVDTGFIVYNEPCYPNLAAMFAHLGVATQASEMSFSVSLDDGRLEYSGSGARGLLAQPGNLLRPRFWSMLAEIRRFYRVAATCPPVDPRLSLGAWLDSHGFGSALLQDHLLPMAAAIWSCPATAVRDHPARAFIRFCDNHGLLRLGGRPQWRTVTGGSRVYVARLAAAIEQRTGCRVLTSRQILSVRRHAATVTLRDSEGETAGFDQIVLATSAGQGLRLLGDASAAERRWLGACRTSRNIAVLHQDPSLMPQRRAAWASWNHLGSRGGNAPPCVTYWMNRLQGLKTERPLFVTLNPPRPPAVGTLLASTSCNHPLFDFNAQQAQKEIWAMQGDRRTWFAGAWLGDGFHEDGIQSGLAVAEAIGGVARPWQVAMQSGRMPGGSGIAARVLAA